MFELVKITKSGDLLHPATLTPLCAEVIAATRSMYNQSGYNEPWTGYLAIDGNHCIGTCAFKRAPQNDRVQIAYFTFPEFEKRGFDLKMLEELVAIARKESPNIVLLAETLPKENASTRILRKLGFEHVAHREHKDEGSVWEWELR
jgi:RimJ/RimL family protein N-acetyltransferase